MSIKTEWIGNKLIVNEYEEGKHTGRLVLDSSEQADLLKNLQNKPKEAAAIDAKAKAEAEAKEKAEKEATEKAEKEAKAKAEAEIKAKKDAEDAEEEEKKKSAKSKK